MRGGEDLPAHGIHVWYLRPSRPAAPGRRRDRLLLQRRLHVRETRVRPHRCLHQASEHDPAVPRHVSRHRLLPLLHRQLQRALPLPRHCHTRLLHLLAVWLLLFLGRQEEKHHWPSLLHLLYRMRLRRSCHAASLGVLFYKVSF